MQDSEVVMVPDMIDYLKGRWEKESFGRESTLLQQNKRLVPVNGIVCESSPVRWRGTDP